MSLTIAKVETQPNRSTAIRSDGRQIEQSTRMSSGTFETAYGEMEWDKYFITNSTLKRREDFVIIRTREVPDLAETFARINRATTLGKRAVRQASVVLGARLKPEAIVCETVSGCVSSSMDMQFGAEFPLSVPELAKVPELDVKEDGEGLSWLRISNRHFDLYADNPAMVVRDPTLGVFIATVTPGVAGADSEHIRWKYADALLTPTTAELPGALGDMSVRAALLDLKPGVMNV